MVVGPCTGFHEISYLITAHILRSVNSKREETLFVVFHCFSKTVKIIWFDV